MPAFGRRPPCCGFIYCSIPTAARLRSPVQSRVFSPTPPFSFLRILTAIFLMVYSLHECLSPLRPYLLFSSHPPHTPVPPTIHSLSWFIGIHFSHSLFPLYRSSSCSATLLPLFYLLPTERSLQCTLHFSLVSENLFLIGSLRKEKPQKLCQPHELTGRRLNIYQPIDSIPWTLVQAQLTSQIFFHIKIIFFR